MEIRPIEERDLSAFARLMGELMGGAPTDPVLLRENFAALQSNENSCVLGAFDDFGDLLGSVYLIFCRDFVDDCRPFAVIENWQNPRAGRAAAARSCARRNGFAESAAAPT